MTLKSAGVDELEQSIPVPGTQFPKGHKLGRYTIDNMVGSGASGVVYRAIRDDDESVVALKVIHPELCGDRQIFGRFHREAAILKRLEGPHQVKLLEVIEQDGLLVLAIEFVDGVPLDVFLRNHREVPVELALSIAIQICEALSFAHERGVVHRDLKPANVILDRVDERGRPDHDPDGTGRVRVVDFGLAKLVHGDLMSTGLTEQNMIFGTPEYMSPEQAKGEEADPRSDIYAAGIILYEMLAGRVPFRNKTPIATMTAHLTEEPMSLRLSAPTRTVPAALAALVHRALAKEADARFESALAMAQALRDTGFQKVIQPPSERKISDTDFAIGDTDLSVDVDGISHSPTIPSPASGPHGDTDPSSAPYSGSPRTSAPTRNSAPSGRAVSGPLPPSIHETDAQRKLWIALTILTLVLAIGAGILFGAK